MKTPLIETSNLTTITSENRTLFKDLNMSLSQEHVALIGRNGVGKSTLLNILSGNTKPNKGNVVLHTKPYFVPQCFNLEKDNKDIDRMLGWFKKNSIALDVLQNEFALAGLKPPKDLLKQKAFSHGEFRKLKMLIGKLSAPKLLILDEPTQDLDAVGVLWLQSWLSKWPNGLLLASHDFQILQKFENFFIVAETGCSYFSGTFSKLEKELEKEQQTTELRYLRNLNRLVKKEERTLHIARRRGRKKRYGRISELGRATPKLRLNQKRDYAQVKHGKMKKIRESRLNGIRGWTKSTRRALNVELPLVLPDLKLPPINEQYIVTLKAISFKINNRYLFKQINLCQKRERVAITGSNGAGKTTLLEIILGKQKPTSGSVERDDARIGSISQGGENWMLDESLFSYLNLHACANTKKTITEQIIAHKFPLALAQRAMHSLSPGERVRAALICLFQKLPTVELLILDEPTCSLDIVGQRALTNALKIWPGGLIIASHNATFLETIGIDQYLHLTT